MAEEKDDFKYDDICWLPFVSMTFFEKDRNVKSETKISNFRFVIYNPILDMNHVSVPGYHVWLDVSTDADMSQPKLFVENISFEIEFDLKEKILQFLAFSPSTEDCSSLPGLIKRLVETVNGYDDEYTAYHILKSKQL